MTTMTHSIERELVGVLNERERNRVVLEVENIKKEGHRRPGESRMERKRFPHEPARLMLLRASPYLYSSGKVSLFSLFPHTQVAADLFDK